MKTQGSYTLTAARLEGSWYLKMFMISLIISLVFASFQAASVFAAPASDQGTTESNTDFEQEWSNKLRNLRAAGYFFDNVRLVAKDFEKPSDLALAQVYLDKYRLALRQANTVVFNHAGFDIKGNVTNEIQADQSLKNLGMYLHMMRGFRAR